jgi:uncharacterized protein (TIGR02001 family)
MTRATPFTLLSAALLAAPVLAVPAAAQDLAFTTGVALEHLVRPDGDGEPSRSSLEGYVEGEVSGFYFGAWAKRSDNQDYDEVDLYFGYRNDLDSGFSYDLSYYRYIYPNDPDSDYGDLNFGVGQTIGDAAYVSLSLGYDPENRLGNAYVGAEVYPADKWTLSANFGQYEVADAPSEREWDIGATYNVSDQTAVDLRWYDGSEYVTGYVGLRLTFDTDLFGG